MWERREKKQSDVARILFNEREGPGKYKANAFPIRVFPRTLALMIKIRVNFFSSRPSRIRVFPRTLVWMKIIRVNFFILPPFLHPRIPPGPRVI